MATRPKVSSARPDSSSVRPTTQVAALCHRQHDTKGKEILLITSRDTGRWIIPKGWPIKGLDNAGSAAQEAWEEAGVIPDKEKLPKVGSYTYGKRLKNGDTLECETLVFEVPVRKLARDFPERAERKRKWVRPKDAARMVDEPELRLILKGFE